MSGIDSKSIALIAIVLAVSGLAYGVLVPGPEGPAGPQGPAGAQGEAGPAGEDIDTGDLAELIQTTLEDELSERLQLDIESDIPQSRGCTSCHVLVDPETGKYTLSYEAHERAEARRGTDTHPNTAPDGTDISLTSEAGLETCLLCHASDPETDRGVIAPLSLRDIVHPAHMGSQTFKVHYGGNCFTCHNVNGAGEFETLGEALNTNDKGVPNPDATSLATGGQLYDKWWKVADGATEPTTDQALMSTQTTNTRTGADSWRCKECHGWDYQGVDGAYGSGSHMSGFSGVYDAVSLGVEEVKSILSGGSNADHDFSGVIDDDSLTTLAEFISNGGVIDISVHIDLETKEVIDGNSANGKILYEATCVICHGSDGAAIGEALGELANGNPWETLHKIRFGQPASAMPSAVDSGWTLKEALDVLAYAQTLG
ncbi:MAG: c-type cytochrome [Candidatus Bathyarchaeia archaeon]